MAEEKSPKDKRLETLGDKTEKQKIALVAQLRRTPIVQIACEKTDVGRSTYYKWRAEDKAFARAADDAIAHGKFTVNDLAESRLIRLIQNDNMTAIIFWLKHNHPAYSLKVLHEYSLVSPKESVEEKEAMKAMFKRAVAWMGLQGEELKRHAETEEREDEEEDRIEERLKAYDDSGGL